MTNGVHRPENLRGLTSTGDGGGWGCSRSFHLGVGSGLPEGGRSRPRGAPRCPYASQAGSDAPSLDLAARLQSLTHPKHVYPFWSPAGSLLYALAWEPHSSPLPQPDCTAVPASHPEARRLLKHGCGAPAAGQDPAGCAEMGLPGLACLGRRLHRTLPPAQKAGAAGGRLGVSDTPFLLPPRASRRRPLREGDLDASAGLGLGWGKRVPAGR